MAQAPNLTGVWHGLYSYPDQRENAVPFIATLISNGPHFSGTTHEISANWRGKVAERNAGIDGTVELDIVKFLKTYEPGSGMTHKIMYSGLLNEDHSEIEGVWQIADSWSGKFLMMRNRHPELAMARKKFAKI